MTQLRKLHKLFFITLLITFLSVNCYSAEILSKNTLAVKAAAHGLEPQPVDVETILEEGLSIVSLALVSGMLLDNKEKEIFQLAGVSGSKAKTLGRKFADHFQDEIFKNWDEIASAPGMSSARTTKLKKVMLKKAREALNPNSKQFMFDIWFMYCYQTLLLLYDSDATSAADINTWVRMVILPVKPDFDISTITADKKGPLSAYDFYALCEEINDQLLINHDMIIVTMDEEEYNTPFAIGEIVPELTVNLETPAGRNIPYYTVKVLHGSFPAGTAKSNCIISTAEHEITVTSKFHSIADTWSTLRITRLKSINLSTDYKAMGEWIDGHACSQHGAEWAAKEEFRQHKLEELCHSDVMALAEEFYGKRLVYYLFEDASKIVRFILKPESSLLKEFEAETDPETKAIIAVAIFELEAKLHLFSESEYPAFSFTMLCETSSPHYKKACEQLLRLINEDIPNLNLTLQDVESFNRRLKKVGRKLYQQGFRSLEDRRELIARVKAQALDPEEFLAAEIAS